MTFEQHPIYKISSDVRRYSKRFDNTINPTLSTEQSQLIIEITNTILDSAYQIHCFLSEENSDFSIFDEMKKELEDNRRDPDWSYFYTENTLKNLYSEVAKHNTRKQRLSNQDHYGKDIASYLMDMSVACIVCLDNQRSIQDHRRNPAIKFREPSASPETVSRERTLSLSDSSDDSRGEKDQSTSL